MKDPIYISVSFRTALLILFFIGIGIILYQLRELIPILVSAIIFALALEPGKRFLARFRIPGQIAVVLLYLFVFSILFLLIYLLVPILAQQSQIFFNALPNLLVIIKDSISGTIFETFLSGFDISNLPAYSDGVGKTFFNIFQNAGVGIASLFGNIVNIMLFLLLTFLFAVNPQSLDNFLSVVTPAQYRSYVEDLWKRTQTKIAQWLQGQLVLIVLIASLTYLALTIIGVPNALFLAIFAGAFEILPIFGPVIGAIPAILMAASTGDVSMLIFTVIAFIIIQQLENNLLYPLIVNKIVGISSVLIVLAIVVGSLLLGIVGIIIAVPLAAIAQELFNDIKTGKFIKVQEKIERENGG